MKNEDYKRFGASWIATQRIYEKETDPQSLTMIFKTLQNYDLAAIETALSEHLRNQEGGQFAPKPADIVRLIDGRRAAHSALAWMDFRKAIRDQRMPESPELCEIIRRHGGLHLLGGRDSQDLDYMEPSFRAVYMAARNPEMLGIGTAGAGALRAPAVADSGNKQLPSTPQASSQGKI